MKKYSYYLLTFLWLAALLPGCMPEEFELGNAISKDALNYSITPSTEDPNMIILQSMTAGFTPMWVTPMGRSTRVKDTVRLAFPGVYKFVYGVQSNGGFVQADTMSLEISTTNLEYVNDPLWNLLTGGVGNEKTWLLDIDADAVSKYFLGPLYFAGTEWGWQGECSGDVDCWIWEADYPGNPWVMPAGNYGTMTFSLQGNAAVTVDHTILGREETGTYFLDVRAKKLSMTDASPLHDEGRDGQVINWGDLKIISLTENTMQLAALRDDALSGEGAALLLYNFISKEYADNWTPADTGDPNIDVDLGGGNAEDLISLSTTKTWSLSPDSPFDWTNLDGVLLNGWAAAGEYPEWTGFDAADQGAITQNKIIFSNDGTVQTVTSDGTEMEGTYAVDNTTNVLSFTGITPAFTMGDWAIATTTAENQWKIVKTKKTGTTVTDIWFGKRDPEKAEYMVFHFVLGSSEVDPAEQARKQIVAALCGPDGSRSFRVSDTWHVDWLDAEYNGGWTTATTFVDDFTSNNWVWTAAVKAGLQDPRLAFSNDGGTVTCTRMQDGETTSAPVTIDGLNNTLTIDMDLIQFSDAANWLPTYGPTWKICKTDISQIETSGLWLGIPTPGNDSEVIAIHYVIAE